LEHESNESDHHNRENMALNELESFLWELLRQYPQGISEFDLLRELQRERDGDFGPETFRDELAMFRAHFLLFHALYRLRDYLFGQQFALLEIHVLDIRLTPWREGHATALATPDPMREYYLNLDHLENTTVQDVEELLGRFWVGYFANEKRAQALQVLGLDNAADSAEIEQSYRKLAMRHHPDRGGDEQQFQQIQQAITVLRRCG
jgi:DnaJ-domain-containing protein 1